MQGTNSRVEQLSETKAFVSALCQAWDEGNQRVLNPPRRPTTTSSSLLDDLVANLAEETVSTLARDARTADLDSDAALAICPKLVLVPLDQRKEGSFLPGETLLGPESNFLSSLFGGRLGSVILERSVGSEQGGFAYCRPLPTIANSWYDSGYRDFVVGVRPNLSQLSPSWRGLHRGCEASGRQLIAVQEVEKSSRRGSSRRAGEHCSSHAGGFYEIVCNPGCLRLRKPLPFTFDENRARFLNCLEGEVRATLQEFIETRLEEDDRSWAMLAAETKEVSTTSASSGERRRAGGTGSRDDISVEQRSTHLGGYFPTSFFPPPGQRSMYELLLTGDPERDAHPMVLNIAIKVRFWKGLDLVISHFLRRYSGTTDTSSEAVSSDEGKDGLLDNFLSSLHRFCEVRDFCQGDEQRGRSLRPTILCPGLAGAQYSTTHHIHVY